MRHLWMDFENGDLRPEDIAELFPYIRLIVFNTYNHTKVAPRFRVVIPFEELISAEDYAVLYNNLIAKIEDTGYSVGKAKGGMRSRLDVSKKTPTSLFYLPCQAMEPFDSFFHDYNDDKRKLLDPMTWIENTVVHFPQSDTQRAALAEPRTVNSAAIEKATKLWRESRKYPGEGNDRFFNFAVSLRSAGMSLYDRAVGVFGWSRDEAVGRTMADLIIPARYREAHRNGLQRYLKSRQGDVLGRRLEVSGIRKNGEEFPVELSISPIQDGERIIFVGCLRDLTERHALNLARAEVAQVTQRMAMGEMTASIVHEINQPLAAIEANASAALRWLARATPNLGEARDALSHIVNDSHRTSEAIGGIRSMFKKDRQAEVPQDVNKLIREVLALVRSDVETQQIVVRTELFDKLPPFPANLAQLRQVLVNLIMNAVDAMSTVVNRPRVLRVKTELHEIKSFADHGGKLRTGDRSEKY